jgi:hypothetical protein
MNRAQVEEVYRNIRERFVQSASRKWGADPADAEDALQTVIIYFLEDWNRYTELKPEDFASRVWKVAETRMRDLCKSDIYRHARERRWARDS